MAIVERIVHTHSHHTRVRYCRKTRVKRIVRMIYRILLLLLLLLLFLYCNRFRMCVCVYLVDGKKLLTGQLRRTVLQFPHTIYLNAQCSGGGAGGKASPYIYALQLLFYR